MSDIISEAQISIYYTEVLKIPSFASQLNEYQKAKVSEYAQKRLHETYDFAYKTMLLNDGFNYPTRYKGRELDYWLDIQVKYREASQVLETLEKTSIQGKPDIKEDRQIIYEAYENFKDYLHEVQQEYNSLIIHYSTTSEIQKLPRTGREYQTDVRYLHFTEQFNRIFSNPLIPSDEFKKYNIEEFYYSLVYQRTCFEKLSESLQIIKDENPDNEYIERLYYSTDGFFITGINSKANQLNRICIKYNIATLRTQLTYNDFNISGRLISIKQPEDNERKKGGRKKDPEIAQRNANIFADFIRYTVAENKTDADAYNRLSKTHRHNFNGDVKAQIRRIVREFKRTQTDIN